MQESTKRAILILAIGIPSAYLLGYLIQVSSERIAYRPIQPGDLASSASLVRKLDSSDPDTVMTGYYYLKKRVDTAGVDKAVSHLSSEDDYIWLNAASYLGVCGHGSSVPYLIKALRHTAWRSDEERVKSLRSITGENFGPDFDAWKSWWDASGNETEIDWSSKLGHAPRISKVDDGNEAQFDPVEPAEPPPASVDPPPESEPVVISD